MKIRFKKDTLLRGVDMSNNSESYHSFSADNQYNFDVQKDVERGTTWLTLVDDDGIVFPAVNPDLIE